MTIQEPRVDEALALAHGLKLDEYQRLVKLIGRTPTYTELGIVSAMWNEHCSYKSSRIHLRKLPTQAPWVIQGPGENAGVIDIGDGDACVFKMESHNHPSFIEPYQGAATGVGGILRDVFTMGARPIATLNLLRFGSPDHPKTRQLVSGVVGGIGGYGNSFGVPTVGGSVGFHRRCNGNILVNAMAVGIARADAIFYAKATGVGNPIVYLGSKTGRDGIHGASMASAAFEKDSAEKRPTVQVGDPFAEKLLLEACLELMKTDAVIAIQDMGAAGLTSSAVEMGAKGNLGIELHLDRVPCREVAMSAYEMMLSESQERMLMVLAPDKSDDAAAIFRKWGLDFAIIGMTTDTKRFVVHHCGEVKADLPIKELGDEAPLYDRPWIVTSPSADIKISDVAPSLSIREALLRLIGSPALSSRRWVYEQYDSLILGNTIYGPGGDAAIVRLGEGPKGLALTTDVTERYCEADPIVGGRQAVAEAWRNLVAVGARPLALTDNLNFGNPEKPEAMGQLVGCLQGIGEAARSLDFPIVSGNVSLYNETLNVGILPTPSIGGVGLCPDVSKTARAAFDSEGDEIVLVGGAPSWIGRSAWLEICEGREEGAPPPVDLAAERRNGEWVLAAIQAGRLGCVHDLSDGGLGIALAEMILSSGLGATIDASKVSGSDHGFFFGEDQGRYVIAAPPDTMAKLQKDAKAAAVPTLRLGIVGGTSLQLPGAEPIEVTALREASEAWFPRYMNALGD